MIALALLLFAAAPQESGGGEDPTGGVAAPETPVESTPASEGAAPNEPVLNTDGAETTPPFRVDHALEYSEIENALDGLALRAGDQGTLETIGHSRGGRAIRVLSLTAPGTPRSDKPALMAVGFGRIGHAYGAEAVLAFGSLLVENAQVEPYASLLTDHVVMLAPALDPDLRAPDTEGPDETRFDLNFPLGWRPGSLRPGAGDFPLSEVEALAAARFLGRLSNLVLIVGVEDGTREARARPASTEEQGYSPWPGAKLPDSDARVFEALVGADARGAELRPWSRLGSLGGGFFDYAFQSFGVYPVAWTAPPTPGSAQALADWTEDVARRTAGLLFSLPRVRIERDELTELAPGLWQLDVAVRNAGSIPTLSALGDERLASGGLMLSLSGAKLVATARRDGPDEPYQLAHLHAADEGVSIGGLLLGGGETRWLRLIVEGEAGATLELNAASARAGSARLERVLK